MDFLRILWDSLGIPKRGIDREPREPPEEYLWIS